MKHLLTVVEFESTSLGLYYVENSIKDQFRNLYILALEVDYCIWHLPIFSKNDNNKHP